MLINSTKVNECETEIILLTKSTEAYLVNVEGQFHLYITDVKNPRHVPEKMHTFSTKEDAMYFIHTFWSERKIVAKYIEAFHETEDKPATERQIKSTKGNALTYGETTWFFAKSRCQKRMKLIVVALQSGIQEVRDTKQTELEKLKNPGK